MISGLAITIQNQVSIFTMEASRITKAQKSTPSSSNLKMILTFFFDFRSIVHHEYAPEGQTINKEYYLEILRCLCNAVQRKHPDMWTGKDSQLYHDNGPAHSTHAIKDILVKSNTALRAQPLCSLDLAPCHFWLFPKLKTTPKGTRFQSRKGMMEKRWRRSEAFQRMSSRGASKSGGGAGKSACTSKGGILKIK